VKAPIEAAAIVLDDVLYPASAYRDRACRIGAGLIRRYCGLNVAEALQDYFVPGEEEMAVRAALEEHLAQVDARWIAKASAAMAACSPRMAPYADAMEILPMLQGMGVRLGLMGDGPPLAQRLVTRALRADPLFCYRVWIRELQGPDLWGAALQLMEMMLECPLDRMAVVCADPGQAGILAAHTPHCYCVFRSRDAEGGTQHPRTGKGSYIPMANLYALPEALGWVTS